MKDALINFAKGGIIAYAGYEVFKLIQEARDIRKSSKNNRNTYIQGTITYLNEHLAKYPHLYTDEERAKLEAEIQQLQDRIN